MDFPERLVLDAPPITHMPVPGEGRYRNIPFRRDDRSGDAAAASSSNFLAKILDRNGSRSGALAISAADARVLPLDANLAVAAGSRAPLGDPMLLFELF